MTFLAAYLAAGLFDVWVSLSIFCLGDVKFDQGCGGFELYAPVTLTAYAPLALFAAVMVQRHPLGSLRLGLASLGIAIGMMQLGWLVPEGGLSALAAQQVVGAGAILWLSRHLRRALRHGSPAEPV